MDVPIRKLQITTDQLNISAEIRAYFEQFGEVECVEDPKDDSPYYFVQFKMVDVASSVLDQNRTHRIADDDVTVEPAEPWNQPDQILNKLNDHCLANVFKYFNFIDVPRVGDVCVRFNEMADKTFPKKFKHLDISDVRQFGLSGSMARDEIIKVMRKYGSLIESLKVDAECIEQFMNESTLSVFSSYCSSNLKELQLVNFNMQTVIVPELHQMLANVEKLRFDSITGDVSAFLAACTELKILWVTNSTCQCDRLTLPKLEETRLVCNVGPSNNLLLLNLKLLKMAIYYSSCLRNEVPFVGANLHYLRELEFGEYTTGNHLVSLEHLSGLSQLKVLKMSFREVSITPLMRALANHNVPLEHLKIKRGAITKETIDSISELKLLKILELSCTDNLDDEDVVTLAKGLTQLQEFHLVDIGPRLTIIGIKKILSHLNQLRRLKMLSCYVSIDLDDYQTMLSTLKKRPEKIQLLIQLISYIDDSQIPETTLSANQDWLDIDYRYEEDDEVAGASTTNTEDVSSSSSESSQDDSDSGPDDSDPDDPADPADPAEPDHSEDSGSGSNLNSEELYDKFLQKI